jgi:hypothetical protein
MICMGLIKFGLLFEHHGEQNQAVAQRAGHRNCVITKA